MEAKAKDRQTLPDMALQTAGSMEAAFELAEANGISLTDRLAEGQELETAAVRSEAVVRRYAAQGVFPASELSADELASIAQEGINFMGIETDFIVS